MAATSKWRKAGRDAARIAWGLALMAACLVLTARVGRMQMSGWRLADDRANIAETEGVLLPVQGVWRKVSYVVDGRRYELRQSAYASHLADCPAGAVTRVQYLRQQPEAAVAGDWDVGVFADCEAMVLLSLIFLLLPTVFVIALSDWLLNKSVVRRVRWGWAWRGVEDFSLCGAALAGALLRWRYAMNESDAAWLCCAPPILWLAAQCVSARWRWGLWLHAALAAGCAAVLAMNTSAPRSDRAIEASILSLTALAAAWLALRREDSVIVAPPPEGAQVRLEVGE